MKKIISLTILLGLVLSFAVIGFSSCGGDDEKKTYSFDYLNEDLSKYVAISPTEYKGYTLTIKLGDVTDKSVEEYLMQMLYEYRSEEAKNPGKTEPLTAGDTLEMWYRGYVKDENGRETEVTGFSNMTSTSAYKLGIGSAKLPLGVESSLVGKVIADYVSLEDAKRATGEAIAADDVVYLSYSLLSSADGQKSYGGVRVDLTRTDIDDVFGQGFRDAIVGKEITEDKTIASFTTTKDGGKLVYSNVKLSVVYPKSSAYMTVEATLPYDYESYDLAGNTIYFDIFPHYFTAYDVPELTETFITDTLKLTADDLAKFDGETLLDKYKASVRAELEANRLEQLAAIKADAMWYHYNEIGEIIEYPEDAVMAVYTKDVEEIELVWSQYKDTYPDFDEFACAYLSLTDDSDWRTKLTDDAKAEVKEKLIFYYIIKTENLLPNENDYKSIYDRLFDEYVVYYMEDKTVEDYASEEAYNKARADAEVAVMDYYGDDFFSDQVYYEYALDYMLEYAIVDIIK